MNYFILTFFLIIFVVFEISISYSDDFETASSSRALSRVGDDDQSSIYSDDNFEADVPHYFLDVDTTTPGRATENEQPMDAWDL